MVLKSYLLGILAFANFRKNNFIMAKVISNVKLRGTVGGITFYKASDQDLAREKGDSGITKKQFAENPIFDRIKLHGKEFGRCSLKSKIFRLLVKPFFDRAKDVSFAGRVNQLLFEITEEDLTNPLGYRLIENGLQSPYLSEILLGFEGNRLRPMAKVCRVPVSFDWDTMVLQPYSLHLTQDLVWPEVDANLVEFQLAFANWDCAGNSFETSYSNVIQVAREDTIVDLSFEIATLPHKDLWLAFLFIGFSNQVRRKEKPLARKWNTVTVVGVRG